jgi:hypothetical protein
MCCGLGYLQGMGRPQREATRHSHFGALFFGPSNRGDQQPGLKERFFFLLIENIIFLNPI